MIAGLELGFVGVLLGAGYGVARTPVRGAFEDLPHLDPGYPAPAWLLRTGLVLVAVGALLVLASYLASPTWEPGARPSAGWSWAGYGLLVLVGLDFIGCALTTFLAAPHSPNRVGILVAGTALGAATIVAAVVIDASNAQPLDQTPTELSDHEDRRADG